MLTERDLDEAIALYRADPHPTPQSCVRLAAFMTLKNELFGNSPNERIVPQQSFEALPTPQETVSDVIESNSEFAEAFNNAPRREALLLMDELSTAIMASQPALYRSVIRRLKAM